MVISVVYILSTKIYARNKTRLNLRDSPLHCTVLRRFEKVCIKITAYLFFMYLSYIVKFSKIKRILTLNWWSVLFCKDISILKSMWIKIQKHCIYMFNIEYVYISTYMYILAFYTWVKNTKFMGKFIFHYY